MLKSIKLGLLISLVGVGSLGVAGDGNFFTALVGQETSGIAASSKPMVAEPLEYNFLNWVADKAKGFASSPKTWGVVLTGVAVWQAKRWWCRESNIFSGTKSFVSWANQFRNGWVPVSPTKVMEYRDKNFLAESEQIFDSKCLLSSTICDGTMGSVQLSAPFVDAAVDQDNQAAKLELVKKVFLRTANKLIAGGVFIYDAESKSFKKLESPTSFVVTSIQNWIPDGSAGRSILKRSECDKMIGFLKAEIALLDTHLERIWVNLGPGKITLSTLVAANKADDLGSVTNTGVRAVLAKGVEKREQAKALIVIIRYYLTLLEPEEE